MKENLGDIKPNSQEEDVGQEGRKVFDSQFDSREGIDAIRIVDMKIDPEMDEGKPSVVFAPGWSRTMATFEKSLGELHKRNRHVLSLDQPRKGGEIKEDEDVKEVPEEILRRATSLLRIIEKGVKDGEKINLVGQSMGGMDVVVAAIMAENEKSGQVGNIVLVDPAGMIGKDSMFGLGKRFSGQMKQNVELKKDPARSDAAKENSEIAASEFFQYIKDNPIRAIKEIKAMTGFQLQGLLEEIKKRGIGISIVQGVDDATFPMDRIQENTTTDQIDGFYSVKGGHNELYYEPEKYMGLVEEALTALERKQIKEEVMAETRNYKILTEKDKELILKQCDLQGDYRVSEILKFAEAYSDAKAIATDYNHIKTMLLDEVRGQKNIEELIKRLALTTDSDNSDEKGRPRYRKYVVTLPDMSHGTEPRNIDRDMEGLCLRMQMYLDDPRDDEMHSAVKIYEEFEKIHPFKDGNGRVGDLIWKILETRKTGKWPESLPSNVFN